MEKKCPYCCATIKKGTADFLLPRSVEDWEIYKYWNEIRYEEENKMTKNILELREDVIYQDYWKKRRVENLIDSSRIWFTQEELCQFVEQISKNLEQTGILYDKSNSNDFKVNFILNKEKMGKGIKVVFELKTENNDDEVFQIIERDVNRNSSVMLCPHCHNILPDGFFQYDQIRIGLFARQDAGKTCLLISMLANSLEALNLDDDLVRFDLLRPRGDLQFFQPLMKRVENFETDKICPPKSKAQYIPPVNFKVTWYKEDGEAKSCMLCLYDAAGESLEATGEGTVTDDIVNYIYDIDGWIFLIDPKDTHLRMEELEEEDEKKLLEDSKILSGTEQVNIQQVGEGGESVAQIIMQMLDAQNGHITRVNKFMSGLVDMIRYEESQKEIAVVLAKCDKVLDKMQYIIDKYDAEKILKIRNNASFFSAEEEERHWYRQDVLRDMFRNENIDIRTLDPAVFKTSSRYMISALGCDTEQRKDKNGISVVKLKGSYSPIRVGEPLVRMVLKLMEEKWG